MLKAANEKGRFRVDTCFSYLRGLHMLMTRETASCDAALMTLLESVGARATVCGDGQALIRRLGAAPASFDAVFTDLPPALPEANALLLRLRQAAPQIPLVVVGPMRSYEGYGFPFGMDITARTFEPLSLGQLEAYFCNFL